MKNCLTCSRCRIESPDPDYSGGQSSIECLKKKWFFNLSNGSKRDLLECLEIAKECKFYKEDQGEYYCYSCGAHVNPDTCECSEKCLER